jgi:hypothetical protein
MDWVEQGEQFLGQYDWGTHGKQMGISRMWRDNETFVGRGKWVQTQRPRGLLSGFLAVLPSLGYGVYIPPVAAKHGPIRFRMRLSEEIRREGVIFSAYLTKEGGLVVEDVLVWKKDPVWSTKPFHERWKLLAQFLETEFHQDTALQGLRISVPLYEPLSAMKRPDANSVLEFVPNGMKQKRLIWIEERTTKTGPSSTGQPKAAGPTGQPKVLLLRKPPSAPATAVTAVPVTAVAATAVATPATTVPVKVAPTNPDLAQTVIAGFVAKRETLLGPDVFSVWRDGEKLGLALVRTLAISKALRLAKEDSIGIKAIWNKQFEKWEIQALASA